MLAQLKGQNEHVGEESGAGGLLTGAKIDLQNLRP